MAREYQAFISYRHAEVDSRVAAEVQRSLEHFHIPAAVRKQTGRTSLAPIFRDKEELPVTAELSDDIGNALVNAKHLIVICSPRLKESTWCQREIETFLKTHPVSSVLTVLAEGEPYDVIPEVLLKRPKTVELEDGTTQEVLVDAEPLSCDFRSPRKAEHRTELTRLAAAMLGVPFDALMRRQQRYRRRLLTAAAAVALAVMAYGAWSLVTINREYQDTLRSQSRALARDALELYESGDTLAAVELALEALPGEGGERPVVAEAERTLQKVSRAYVPLTSDVPLLRAGVADYGAVRSFDLGHDVEGVTSTPDGSVLAAWAYTGDVTCWDTATGKELYQGSFDEYTIVGVHLIDPTHLVIVAQDSMLGVDLATGAEAWRKISTFGDIELDSSVDPQDAFDFFAWDSGIDEKTGLLVVQQNANDKSLLLIDPYDGTVTNTVELGSLEGEYDTMAQVEMTVREGSCALPWSGESYGKNPILLADLEGRTGCVSEDIFTDVQDVTALSGGKVLVTSSADEEGASELGSSSAWTVENAAGSYVQTSLSPYAQRLTCLDVHTGKALWTQDINLWQVTTGVSVLPLSLGSGKNARQALVWCGANVCVWLDQETGEQLGRVEAPSDFVDAWVGESWDAQGKEGVAIEGCLSDGQYVWCARERSQALSCRAYPARATCATSSERGEFVACGTTVQLYATGQGDDSWHRLSDMQPLADELVRTPAGLVVFDSVGGEEETGSTVALYDLAGQELVWETSVPKASGESLRYAGITSDEQELVFVAGEVTDDECQLVRVSLADGKTSSVPVAASVPSMEAATESLCGLYAALAGNYVVSEVHVEDNFQYWLCATDLTTMASTLLVETTGLHERGVGNAAGVMLAATQYAEEDLGGSDINHAYTLFDLAAGTSVPLDAPLTRDLENLGSFEMADAFWGDDGTLYAHTLDAVVAYKADGTRLFEVPCAQDALVGMGLVEDELWLALWDDGKLLVQWYDAKRGKLREECHPDLDVDADNAYTLVRVCALADSPEAKDGLFVLMLDERAAVCDRQGQVYQVVENCLWYDTACDVFVVADPDMHESGFGLYPRYSLEGLVERGRQLLGDSRMSAARREEYGL